jgi:hypothetical protein
MDDADLSEAMLAKQLENVDYCDNMLFLKIVAECWMVLLAESSSRLIQRKLHGNHVAACFHFDGAIKRILHCDVFCKYYVKFVYKLFFL